MKDYKNSVVKEDVYGKVLLGFCLALVVVLSVFLYFWLGV